MRYLALIWLEHNRSYSVMFPDLAGCFSMGANLQEAIENAHEALDLYLEEHPVKAFHRPSSNINLENFQELSSSYLKVHTILVNKHNAFALKLRWLREDLGLTQKQLAQRLNIGLYAYQRLEKPLVSNATIKTIEQVEKAIERELIFI